MTAGRLFAGVQENTAILSGEGNGKALWKMMKYIVKQQGFLFTFVRYCFIMGLYFMIEAVCAWEK
jgi:hypothetical protein